MEQTLRERGDSEPQIKLAVAIAREQFQQKRVYAGELKEHGSARYEFNEKNERSYYVKLKTLAGKQDTVWGVHLKDAITQGEAKVGDHIFLAYQGRTAVTIEVNDRDDKGQVTGTHEVQTHRNTWAVERFDRLSQLAHEKLNAAARETAMQPVVKQYDHIALAQTRNMPPPVQDHHMARQR